MNNNAFDLTGKVAVVTGGAGLIGREIVKKFAQAGAIVIAADNNKRKARDMVSHAKDIHFEYLDIASARSVKKLISSVVRRFGRIDIWINSAYPRTKDWGRKLEDVKFSSWKKNVDMHLGGYFLCCQQAVIYMQKQNKGVIINLASIYGLNAPDFSLYRGTTMTVDPAYAAIKGGVITLTKYLASYCGKYNIRVNCISPGGVFDNQPPEFVDRYNKKTLLGRMASVSDIANTALFLAADACGYVNGQNLVVDGGWSIS